MRVCDTCVGACRGQGKVSNVRCSGVGRHLPWSGNGTMVLWKSSPFSSPSFRSQERIMTLKRICPHRKQANKHRNCCVVFKTTTLGPGRWLCGLRHFLCENENLYCLGFLNLTQARSSGKQDPQLRDAASHHPGCQTLRGGVSS